MPAFRPRQRPAGARPRRRHPARVYWVRRGLVATVLAALVVGLVGLGQLVTGLLADESGATQATSAGSGETGAPSDEDAANGAGEQADEEESASSRAKKRGASKKATRSRQPRREPLAQPDAECVEEDVVVTPSVRKAVGGSPISIRLDLTTLESDACWWRVSPETLAMRITSGKDEIWTSRECPEALPEQLVVVRKERRERLVVQWSARRSGEDCNTARSEWALPGFYYVQAAAFAGEPRESQFELTRPKESPGSTKPRQQRRKRQSDEDPDERG